MKSNFPGYYYPTRDEFAGLWSNCLFVFDSNVLLNLYRYTPQTSEEFIGILQQISNRLWIPHQVGLEYQKRRLEVIGQQVDAYDQVREVLHKKQKALENELRTFLKHPFIDSEQLLETVVQMFKDIEGKLEGWEKGHPSYWDDDPIRDPLTDLFEGKVGPCYSEERLREIHEEGKQRYEDEVPPGYMDSHSKKGGREYGDLVLWRQVIDKMKDMKQPAILVTDDRKEDWWWKVKGQTVGPRPELIEEMRVEAGVTFYMYSPEKFMEYAGNYLDREVEQAAINEVHEVRKQDDKYLVQAQGFAPPRRLRSGTPITNIMDELAARANESRIQPITTAPSSIFVPPSVRRSTPEAWSMMDEVNPTYPSELLTSARKTLEELGYQDQSPRSLAVEREMEQSLRKMVGEAVKVELESRIPLEDETRHEAEGQNEAEDKEEEVEGEVDCE